MDIEKREKLRSRLRSAKHLPEFMRDFHDQKDLFKTIQSVMETKNPETCGSVNWMLGQCYCIDVFLKFMAMHGYELRKVGDRVDDDETFDLKATMEKKRKTDDAVFKKWMEEQIGKPPGE